MIQGFYTGINGIKTHQFAIDVVADNLANIDTVGFRGYSAEFATMFDNALNTSSNLSSVESGIGLGTKINGVAMNENTGSLLITERDTDLAILGDGWFGINSGDNTYYTRDGSFGFDENRDLITTDGYYVLGTMGTNISNGILTQKVDTIPLGNVSTQQKLQFPSELTFPVQPTTEATFFGNLTVQDTTRVVSAKAIDASSNQNTIRLEFTRANPQTPPGIQWNVTATAQTSGQRAVYMPSTGETIYEPIEVFDTQSGVISFDENGGLISSTLSSINNNGTQVSLNFGTGYDGLISSGENDYTASSKSNGKEKGDLIGYDINNNGEVVAAFTNGEQSSVAAIAIYHFGNDKGLERINGSRFKESSNSGRAMFYQDQDGNAITGVHILNNRLENSNVEMEVGLTELIVMQRSYDANAKSITTADEMIQKAINMKK